MAGKYYKDKCRLRVNQYSVLNTRYEKKYNVGETERWK